jgi:hypothetical protein
MRGDLAVSVAVDGTDIYDDGWRNNRCGRIQVDPSEDGPGDVSCLNFEARVAYQLAEPQELPAGAEDEMRALLAAAVESLPM